MLVTIDTSAKWGVCVPGSCTPNEVTDVIAKLFKDLHFSNYSLNVIEVPRKYAYTTGAYIAMVICSLFAGLVLVASLRDAGWLKYTHSLFTYHLKSRKSSSRKQSQQVLNTVLRNEITIAHTLRAA